MKSTCNLLVCGAALILGLLLGAPRSAAAPEPEAVPRRWELQVEAGPLRLTSVDVPGKGAQPYFYFTYKVTNNSGKDLYFAPSFDLGLSDGTVLRSGRDVPPEATAAILRSLRNSFMTDEVKAQGNLLQGPENAREAVVVWPATSLHLNEVTVYAAGFSGETKSVVRPDNGKPYVLRKSLMLRFTASGDLNPADNKPLTKTAERWILR